MSDDHPHHAIDIREWVDRVRDTPNHRERQATEVLLVALGATPAYRDKLYLKGGMLMGLVHGSPRQTADIDLTTSLEPTNDEIESLRADLNRSLRRTPALIGYPDLVCCIQTVEQKPRPDHFEAARFPGLKIKVAYADRDSRHHERLTNGNCPTVLNLDISYHEPVHAVEFVDLDEGSSLATYSITDVIAEKLRALLQQVSRNHPPPRRQDVYDLAFLARQSPPDDADKAAILQALREKARARDVEPLPDSLSNSDIRDRAAQDWDSLNLELAELPPFDQEYEVVEALYRSLPW